MFVLSLNKNKKSASVLLLSLMIIFSILSTTLYINVLSIRSIKESQNIDNSIVAFYIAETGNEQAIYYLRNVPELEPKYLIFPESKVTTIDNLVSRKVSDEINTVLIGLKKNEVYQLDAFDQKDLSLKSSISHLLLKWSNSNPSIPPKIELTVNSWKPDEDIDWGYMQNQMHISKCILNNSPVDIDNQGDICPNILLDENMSYQFRFKALNTNISSLSIKAFDSKGKQVAFKNVYNIESIGEYPFNSKYSNRQALRVNLKKYSPLSALFDYVLFSEKSLVKDIGAYTGGWFNNDLYISTDVLADAKVNSEYSYALNAVNGKSPYKWILSGDVSGNLEIDAKTGILYGKFQSTGTYLLNISVEDQDGDSDSKTFFLQVNE